MILPQNLDDIYFIYSVPVKEFELQSLHIKPGKKLTLQLHNMPGILLCYQGEVIISEHKKVLSPGKTAFITSDISDLTLRGQGIIWLATVPV
jgi:mannose-6-phosphate isomerase class I